jgi:hypothetical protein
MWKYTKAKGRRTPGISEETLMLKLCLFLIALTAQAGWYNPAPVVAPDPFERYTIAPDYGLLTFEREVQTLEAEPKQVVYEWQLIEDGYALPAVISDYAPIADSAPAAEAPEPEMLPLMVCLAIALLICSVLEAKGKL